MEHEERGQMPTEAQIESEMTQHDAVMELVKSDEETDQQQPIPEQEELSIGKRIIGDFNPEGDEKVLKVNEMCAELIDIVIEHQKTKGAISMLIDHTISEILNAQMNVVKILTFKE